MLTHIDHHGWKAVQLSTSRLELVTPLEIGPRLVTLRRSGGGRNLFAEIESERGGCNEAEFRLRGGHRLWHAPEDPVRTYQPDNRPPRYVEAPDSRGFTLEQDTEPATGVRKTLAVELLDERSLRVTHRLENRGTSPIETAAWALTMFRPGGRSVIPLLPRGSHPEDLLPSFGFVQWPYTDLSLECWRLFPSFLSLDSREVRAPQKIGLTNYPGWSGYWIDGDLFVKHAPVIAGAKYPDLGCPFEHFANGEFCELETLGALTQLASSGSLVHVEHWGVLTDVPEPSSEAVYRSGVLPTVEAWLTTLDRSTPAI